MKGMANMYCPDNYDAFCRHDAEQEKALAKLPECSECGEPIQEDECYEFNGELICLDCMEEHRMKTENFIY